MTKLLILSESECDWIAGNNAFVEPDFISGLKPGDPVEIFAATMHEPFIAPQDEDVIEVLHVGAVHILGLADACRRFAKGNCLRLANWWDNKEEEGADPTTALMMYFESNDPTQDWNEPVGVVEFSSMRPHAWERDLDGAEIMTVTDFQKACDAGSILRTDGSALAEMKNGDIWIADPRYPYLLPENTSRVGWFNK